MTEKKSLNLQGSAPFLCIVCQRHGVWDEYEICRNCNERVGLGGLTSLTIEEKQRLQAELQRRREVDQ